MKWEQHQCDSTRSCWWVYIYTSSPPPLSLSIYLQHKLFNFGCDWSKLSTRTNHLKHTRSITQCIVTTVRIQWSAECIGMNQSMQIIHRPKQIKLGTLASNTLQHGPNLASRLEPIRELSAELIVGWLIDVSCETEQWKVALKANSCFGDVAVFGFVACWRLCCLLDSVHQDVFTKVDDSVR